MTPPPTSESRNSVQRKPGAPVVIQVWRHPQRCDLVPLLGAVRALRLTPSGPAPLWEPGTRERCCAGVEHSGEDAVRGAIAEQLAPLRKADDGYRMENEWTYLIAASPS